jgi:ABC-type molybdate transport system substrate-binding protein
VKHALVVAALMLVTPAGAQELQLLAAGSLRGAMTEIAAAHGGVAATFGPSGLLRERIEKGEAADVFASANLAHPARLARERGRPMVLFARNRLCAVARPGLEVTSATLLERMLDPAIALGTSTPRADPSGDYAWEVFAKAEALRPGARAALEAKARQLVGGANSAQIPPGQSGYGFHISQGNADIFLSYCTNARNAAQELLGATTVALPPELAVGAEYGLVVLGESVAAARLALFVLSPAGQAILAKHGFEAPNAPVIERLPQ